jgi:hypothetical protein
VKDAFRAPSGRDELGELPGGGSVFHTDVIQTSSLEFNWDDRIT